MAMSTILLVASIIHAIVSTVLEPLGHRRESDGPPSSIERPVLHSGITDFRLSTC